MGKGPDLVELITAEYPRLFRTALLIVGDRQSAEELTQEAFARLVERWDRLQAYDSPGAWLRLVVVRQSLRHRSRRSREVRSDPMPEPLWSPHESVDGRLDALDAIQSLPPGQREVVVLYYVYDLTTDTIAAELGRKPGTVRAQLHQARQRLGTVLQQEVTDVP